MAAVQGQIIRFDPKFTPCEIERLCFQFGGALLIPRATFRKEIGEIRSQFSTPELRLYKPLMAFLSRH